VLSAWGPWERSQWSSEQVLEQWTMPELPPLAVAWEHLPVFRRVQAGVR